MKTPKLLKNKKFLSYSQFLFTAMAVAFLMTAAITKLLGGKGEYIIEATFSITKVVFVSIIGIIILREVKYFKIKILFVDSAYMSLVIIMPIVALFYRYFFEIDSHLGFIFPYEMYNWVLYLIIVLCLIYSTFHIRYGIASALIIAAVYPITGYVRAEYFVILGFFLLLALGGYILKKVFFTPWTSYVKEEEPPTEEKK